MKYIFQGKLFWESNPGAEVASGSTGNLAETSSGRITSFIDASGTKFFIRWLKVVSCTARLVGIRRVIYLDSVYR